MKGVKLGRGFLVRVIITIVLLGVFFKWINLFDSLQYVKDLGWVFFVFAAFTILIINIAKMFRFYYLSRDLKLSISLKDTTIAHFIAPIIGRITPAKLGEGFKIFILKGDKKKLGFVFILEKLADTFTLLIISVFAVYTFGSFYSAYATLAVLFIIMVFALFNFETVVNLMFRKNILKDNWFKSELAEVSQLQWIIFIGFSTIIRFLILSVPYIIAVAFKLDVSIWLIFQMYAVSMLVGWLSGLPGGIGTREISFSFLLVNYASISLEIAGIVAILVIVTDLIIESLLALIGWGWMKVKRL